MKKNLFNFFGRFFILIIVFLFSAGSMLLSIFDRGVTQSQSKKFFAYASYFEENFYDLRMNQGINPKSRDTHQVLAALDDLTFQKVGRWPWSRNKWVEVLSKLNHYGAKVLAFDVVFPEPELAWWANSPDLEFKQAIVDFQQDPLKHVVLSYSLAENYEPAFKETPPELYDFVLNTKAGPNQVLMEKKISSHNFPIPILLEAKPSLGYINAVGDPDGVFRQYSLISNIESTYFPSLGLMAYMNATRENFDTDILDDGAIIKFKKGKLYLNRYGETKIRYFGGMENFPTVSMYSILSAPANDPVMKKLLGGKIVFIGSTAFGAHDIRHTPVDAQLPGVYFHMNMIHMLTEGYFFKSKDESIKYSLIFLVAGLTLLFMLQFLNNAFLDLLLMLALTGSILYFDLSYFTPNGYELKLFFSFFGFFLFYLWNTLLNFYKTSKEKKQIKGTFSRYVAPSIVNEMLNNPDKLKVGGEKRNITVIFSDVRDFTSISEKLTAQQLSLSLNFYMGQMTDILFETYGTLDKYIGDALVGYWGAPLDVPNHAYHGVRGALKMIETLPAINAHFKAQDLPEFKIGIGLNTGECSVGNMGSDKIFSYTALGDNMNLGSRLESLCKTYGCQLLISEFTYAAIAEVQRQEFTFREIDLVKVKGKDKAVKIYEVLYSTHPLKMDPALLATYHEGYHHYLAGRFKESLVSFMAILKLHEDKTTKRHLVAAEEFLVVPPPPDWDGVTVHKEK